MTATGNNADMAGVGHRTPETSAEHHVEKDAFHLAGRRLQSGTFIITGQFAHLIELGKIQVEIR